MEHKVQTSGSLYFSWSLSNSALVFFSSHASGGGLAFFSSSSFAFFSAFSVAAFSVSVGSFSFSGSSGLGGGSTYVAKVVPCFVNESTFAQTIQLLSSPECVPYVKPLHFSLPN